MKKTRNRVHLHKGTKPTTRFSYVRGASEWSSRQLLDAICGEILVECSPANFGLVNDIADEWVVFGVHKNGFGVFDVLLVHSFWSATSTSALCGGFETGAGVFNNQLALKLVKVSCHVEKQPLLWGSGVDVLGQRL
jgi:hypothetical protein